MGLFWGIFGPQNVRAVLNRAIFNHWVSNLDCAHDFKISPPAKQKTPIFWAICAAFGVMPLFRVNFFPQFSFYLNSFYPNFFLPNFFLPNFFLPKFFYQNFFFTQTFFFKFFLGHFFFFDQIFSSIFSIFFHI